MEQSLRSTTLIAPSDIQSQPLPETFVRWQIAARRAMYQAIAAGGHPRRHPAHLPVMITFTGNGNFPVHVATKGAGFTPRDDVLDAYLARLQETEARCAGRPWEETLPERVAAVQALLEHPEDIDFRRLGFLEIFQGRTYANLQRDPRVVLHFTGDGPDYPSFQINAYAQILDPDDPRYRYIALARYLFEQAPFHLPQPGYAAAYLIWVQEVFNKTPYSLSQGAMTASKSKTATKAGNGSSTPLASHLWTPPSPFPLVQEEVTFREILVPLDNSKYSAWAMDVALQIAGAFRSTVVGSHVYAARLHDKRFRDMEPDLPEEYQEPTILAHQRELHDTLIEKGLKLISDSYIEVLKQRCQAASLRFVGKTPEGKNYAELVRDITTSRYDLVVMGVRGIGETWRRGEQRDQVLGSVCERVVRRVTQDVLVVKNDRPLGGTFVVGVDGSDRGFAALRVAIKLAEVTGARVQVVAAYDPFLHKALFHELEDVLTEEAKQVFDTEAQKKLHDELVDSGIGKLYQRHLDAAQRVAAELGAEIETHLLAGKAYAAVLRHVQKVQPSLLLIGRTGLHADAELDIGSNAENLLRLAPCHVLLVGRTFTSLPAETRQTNAEHMPWTPEALARLERVPGFARGMARKAIEDYARERGLSTVDEQIMMEARQRFGLGM
jgi:nucleotide-binding universal stress UspA family protein